MKASELIKELQKMIDEHGDKKVLIEGDATVEEPTEVFISKYYPEHIYIARN